jgi:twitching motility protein PilT
LVLSTLHTIDASKTIDRIVGVFPKNEERQIRTRFAQTFKWIVSQRLIPKKGGGRMAVCEILRSTSRTRDYIQEGEREGRSLQDAMDDGAIDGMQSFDSVLERLIESGRLDKEVGLSYATNATNLALRLGTESAAEREATRVAARPPAPAKGDAPSNLEDLIER